MSLGDLAHRLEQNRVGGGVVAGEAGLLAAEVVRIELLVGADEGAGEEAAPERRVRHEGHAQFGGGRHDLLLDVAAEQRPLGLEGGDRVDCLGGSQFATGDLAEAEVLDLAGGDEFGHHADGLLDRHVHIAAVHVVEVDGVDAETLEAGVDTGADVRGIVVDEALRGVARVHAQGELGGQHHLVTVRLEEGARNFSFSPAA